MVVDALMQIPWLSAIVSGLAWVVHAVWAVVGSAWRTVVLFFSTYIPLALAWAAQRLSHWLVVIAVWVAILALIWEAVLALMGRIVAWTVPVDELAAWGGQWWAWMWGPPLNLSTGWAYVKRMPPIIAGVMTCRILWRRLRWAMVTLK